MLSKVSILLLTSVVQTAFWLVVLWLDPFGLSSAADQEAEGIFQKIYPAGYPGFAPAEWRDHIKVVMIDDRRLPLKDGGSPQWPLQFREQVELVEKVRSLGARGVFVDFLFDTDQGRNPAEFDPLIDSLQQTSAAPVIFASYADQRTLVGRLKTLPYSSESTSQASLGLVELTASANHYPLFDGAKHPSAAVALYNATLKDLGKSYRPIVPNVDGRASDMLLAWGYTFARAKPPLPMCSQYFDDVEGRATALFDVVRSGLLGSYQSEKWQRLQPCAYHEEISARELFEDDSNARAKQESIKGSYVFIGGAIKGSGDVVVSPVHGQLPGVYLHAMALDNLLSFQGSYLGPDRLYPYPHALVFFLAALFGGALFWRAPPTSRGGAASALIWRVAAWIAFQAAAIALLLGFLLRFAWVPHDWAVVLASIGVVVFTGIGELLIVLLSGRAPALE